MVAYGYGWKQPELQQNHVSKNFFIRSENKNNFKNKHEHIKKEKRLKWQQQQQQ